MVMLDGWISKGNVAKVMGQSSGGRTRVWMEVVRKGDEEIEIKKKR